MPRALLSAIEVTIDFPCRERRRSGSARRASARYLRVREVCALYFIRLPTLRFYYGIVKGILNLGILP
jgi:hypothetical protein